jgi:hypothetical protein
MNMDERRNFAFKLDEECKFALNACPFPGCKFTTPSHLTRTTAFINEPSVMQLTTIVTTYAETHLHA